MAVDRFSASYVAVPAARAATGRILWEWRIHSAAIETAKLVISELATNAIKASPADGQIAFRLTASGDRLVIEVWDSSGNPPALTGQSPDREGGRGLFLVDALSIRWSWYRPKAGGKVVWSQIHAETLRPTPHPPTAPAPSEKLAKRTPQADPAAVPVTFQHDPALLQRVADGLRALDDWHLPNQSPIPPGVCRAPPAGQVGRSRVGTVDAA
ncbi:ATP-binding protein [Frankia sp. AvcI1]|uniref:ATP-binding protein n=1 Tax=Frankia sp. AvcI1 TaxID=573496 RepID=UPI0021174880|nr:ATP-binding protein [Frankia sp. AvcI1]